MFYKYIHIYIYTNTNSSTHQLLWDIHQPSVTIMPWQRIGSTWSADLRSALQVTLHEGFRAKWFRSRSSTATLTSPAIDAIVDVLAKRFEVLVWSNLGMTLKLRKELLSLNHGISNLMDVTRGAQGRLVGATLEAGWEAVSWFESARKDYKHLSNWEKSVKLSKFLSI